MLLTLSAPAKPEFDFKSPHDFSPPFPPSTKLLSPKGHGESSLRSLQAGDIRKMSAPHRGLPPPAAMTLPDPSRVAPSTSQSFGQMPAPPSQWQGAEDSMRNWLVAKAEEDRRRQEEEKTRQETLRLEQRKIEQAMLRDSMQGGVPPHLVPMIFAGIGGANLANVSLDWLQQYAAQLQAAQQQQQLAAQAQAQQVSPDLRRETRLINPPQSVYGISAQPVQTVLPNAPVLPGQNLPPQPPQAGGFSTYQAPGMSPSSRARAAQPSSQISAPTSAPRPPSLSQLPRLNTNEMQIHQTPPVSSAMHPLHQSQTPQQDQPASSPSIYFHHWVPPSSQAGSDKNIPATPSGKRPNA